MSHVKDEIFTRTLLILNINPLFLPHFKNSSYFYSKKMKPYYLFLTFPIIWLAFTANAQTKPSRSKQQVIQSIENHQKELIALSDEIWAYAETALKENQSSRALADYAEDMGFTVKRCVADLPTAFIASYGTGKPIIGILGEFDALPGLSQKVQTTKEELEEGANGHGCGHNLFGAASIGSAVAIKELIEQGKLKGTIRFYGTPAEEAIGGKIYMARAGLFDDLDACMVWHPDVEIYANTQSSQALLDMNIEFFGKASHAAYDPWNGRSATDGMELFLMGVNMLREHIKPSVRIHYIIEKGGEAPNIVPEYAKVWLWVRDSEMSGVKEVVDRVKDIAIGAGLMAGVESQVSESTGVYNMLVNRTGAVALQKNLETLGSIKYTDEEIAFANQIQKNCGMDPIEPDGEVKSLRETQKDPEGGSTDVAEVSWNSPIIYACVTTAPRNIPWHSWAVVAFSGMSIGHKGMIYASKAMAMTMVDLFEDEELLKSVQKEFKERKGDLEYKAIIPEGPPKGN